MSSPRLGADVRVGDSPSSSTTYDEAVARRNVAVTLGGVDDPDGADEFRLVVPGRTMPLEPAAGDAACGADDRRCRGRVELTFDVGDAPGGVRVLLYRRGDDERPLGIDRRCARRDTAPAAPVTRRYRDSAHG